MQALTPALKLLNDYTTAMRPPEGRVLDTGKMEKSVTNMIQVPVAPTDKMVQAAQQVCDLTPTEALHVYQTMHAAYEDGDATAIFDELLEKKTDSLKQTAILAAEAVDLRAGNAVRKALER